MSNGLSLEQCKDIVAKWQSSPIIRHYSFSDKRLWGKQEEILWAMRKYPRIAVKSCNSGGKTFTAADAALDWLITRPNSIVVTTAPTFHQVETILWREIRHACFSAKIPIGATPLNTELKFSDKWYAVGISTDNPVNFQGKHSDTGNLLVIGDEASGLMQEIGDIIEALLPKCVLLIGNPLEATGYFADCFQSHRWHKITISGPECVEWQNKNGKIPGLITAEWIKDMADLHGVRSAWYRTHVLGEFPEQDEFALIERQWVDRARKGLDSDGLDIDDENEDAAYKIISCDVASKHGENESVVGYRFGHTFKDIKAFRKQTQTYLRDQVTSSYNAVEANIVVFDSDGLGEPMAELMSEVHIPSLEFHGGYGQKAIEGQRYRNLRSQFYWMVAKKFEKGLYNLKHLPDKEFDILRGQLCSIRVKAPDALGRFQIETKEDMMARQIKSPDYADCFMMSEYAHFMRRMAELRPHKMGAL